MPINETPSIQVIYPEGQNQAELIIRHGHAKDEIPNVAPQRINFSGTIDTPLEILRKKRVDIENSHIEVCRNDLSIKLCSNAKDYYNSDAFEGSLKYDPAFKLLGINNLNVKHRPADLGQLFKMNRGYFEDKSNNMDLVSKLKSFEAKIDSIIEKEEQQNGSRKDNYSSVVSSNLPESFMLKIPVFIGREKETIEVEFYSYVNGREILISLCSPSVSEIIEQVRDSVIDEQLKQIRELCPELPILEK